MSNKYFVKDPTFKHFLIGLVAFLIIIVVGVYGVKKLIKPDGMNIQDNNQSQQEDKHNGDREPVAADDGHQTINQDDQKTNKEENNTPAQLAETGSDFKIVNLLVIMGITYACVWLGQKFF